MNTKEQVTSFLDCCEELKKCKFIMATTKIKDLLKCIVNCPDIYRLFEAVTKDFNYPEYKSQCLVTENSGMFERHTVVLPRTVGKRLAFIFCLFAEFDKDTLNFNDFLRKYYPEDGSYFASYQAFCAVIVCGLQEAVKQVFYEELTAETDESGAEATVSANPAKAELISALSLALAEEARFVVESRIPEEDKEGGLKILTQLFAAIKAEDEELIDALMCGYHYFCLYHNCVSDKIAGVIQSIADFEKVL